MVKEISHYQSAIRKSHKTNSETKMDLLRSFLLFVLMANFVLSVPVFDVMHTRNQVSVRVISIQGTSTNFTMFGIVTKFTGVLTVA